jgi:alpha-tubulin suppressor-like RCC1 family protein
VIGIGDLELARCTVDSDCDALNAQLAPDACERFACEATTARCALRPFDADGDGAPSIACGGMDCDDMTAGISPAATEICNGVDDDCDGTLDGPDEDDDGDMHAGQCAGALASDCDDEDERTHFDAPELCDGVDNDCVLDGFQRFTGGMQLEPSEDVDGDRHASTSAMCVVPDGIDMLFPLDDCNDEAASVYAGAFELCDAVDNDCDGVPDDSAGSTSPGSACLPVAIAPGLDSTCAIGADGFVTCWGDNTEGELGSTGVGGEASIRVPSVSGATRITTGWGFACAIGEDGRVTCWGRDLVLRPGIAGWMVRSGAIGLVRDLPLAREIDAGSEAVCALVEDGTVRCWGNPRFGVLDGTWDMSGDTILGPQQPAGVTDVTQLSLGDSHACAVRSSGIVTCWGSNYAGSLGDGTTDIATKVSDVIMIADAVEVGVGARFACARRSDGTVSCWGTNDSGQLGCSACPSITGTPLPVAGITGAVELAIGSNFACARLDTGRVRCWGSNSAGQLGNGLAGATSATPVEVENVEGATSVRAGNTHVCALTARGAFCWGEGAARQLGDGRVDHPAMSPFRSTVPRPVSVLANTVEIASGRDDTCFRLPNLTVRCAGGNTYDEIGGPTPFEGIARGSFGEGIVQIGRGPDHTCVVETGGTVRCFGLERDGRLGHPSGDSLVPDLTGVASLALGDEHSCVLTDNAEVYCWGQHSDGQAGVGNVPLPFCDTGGEVCQRTPARVEVQGVRQIVAGAHHTCVLFRDGAVSCWGRNDRGQLGSPPLGQARSPRGVVGLPPGVVSLAAGGNATCAVLGDGAVSCWGAVPGAVTTGIDPTPVSGLSGVQELTLSASSACARLASGQVRCWGDNSSGQLGNGTTISSSDPVNVQGLPDARHVECGPAHCCAVRTSGQAVCWGANARGQLGTADAVDSSSPRTTVDLTAF